MRDLLDLLDIILTESPKIGEDELAAMKSVIANKIKNLPDDDVTAKALREIEDLLKHIGAGGKLGIINGELQSINDESVNSAQKLLARYILSIDMTAEQRNDLFNLWRKDKLVKKNVLLGKGKKNFSDIITHYNENPAIEEISNDLMRITALGQGKGEFGLSVMSKSISKPDKGDLLIDGRKIEAKTTEGGAGRFTDQEVRPSKGFESAANTLNDFVTERGFGIPASGVSLNAAVDIGQQLEGKDKNQYFKLVETAIKLIFGGSDVSSIMSAIKSGNQNQAKAEYAKASFNYYMSKKDDEGVLYINLTTNPITTVFFKDADELTSSALRLQMKTAYITSTADVRLPYPQMDIVDTSFGANAAAAAEKKATKTSAKLPAAAPTTSAASLDAASQKRSGIKASGMTAAPIGSSEPTDNKQSLGRARRR
jgi:hypothetical protein